MFQPDLLSCHSCRPQLEVATVLLPYLKVEALIDRALETHDVPIRPSVGNRVFMGQSTLQSLTCLTQKIEMRNIVDYREKAPRQMMTEFSQGLRRCQKPIAQD